MAKKIDLMNKIIRDFKRHYHKARKLIPDINDQGSFNLRVDFQENKLTAGISTPSNEISVQFAVLMRRFLAPNSDLYFDKIIELLRDEAPQVLTEEIYSNVQSYIQSMNHGPLGIQVNNDKLSAEDIYTLISDGEYFGNESKAASYLKELSVMPIVGPLFWHQFYSYALDGFYLVSNLFDLISQWQSGEDPDEAQSNHLNKCIYCLRSDRSFNSEEHIFPEALGNDEAILPKGYVCDECNNGILSRLDSYLINFEPISLMRVQYVPYTKSGKLPKANIQNISVDRTYPRHIVFTSKDKSGEIRNKKELGEGWYSWNMEFRGKPMNAIRLGRSLYKIGLGFVALNQGRDKALSSRFELARNFIKRDIGFPNDMLISTKVQPRPGFRVTYRDLNPGCIFVVDIFGIIFMFNLEDKPLIDPIDDLIEMGFQTLKLEE